MNLSTLSPSIDAGLIEGRQIVLQPAARVRASGTPADAATRGSHRSLDWFSFFLADIQTGFGPFVAIYLTAHQWAQFDIGLDDRFHETDQLEPSDSAGKCGSSSWLHMIRTLETFD